VLADVNKEAGEALAAELGANARFVATDVTNEESAKGAFAAAVEMGTLRGLVNCAGIAPAEKVVGREGPTSWSPSPAPSTSTWWAAST
jgi:NAD(P)-dependent dehydrogenase (short-subunit alcohol dehydrogenase family)